MRNKLEQRKAELEQKLHMFLNSERGLRYGDIIKKLKNELDDINEQLGLMEQVKDAKPIEEKQVDTVLLKAITKYESAMESIEFLRSIGNDYTRAFNELQKQSAVIDERVSMMNKINGATEDELLPKHVKDYRAKVGAIKKQLEADELEKAKAELELSADKKATLAKIATDMSFGLDFETSEEGDAE